MKTAYKNVLIAVPPPSHQWYKQSVDALRKVAATISLVPGVHITFISIVSTTEFGTSEVNILPPDVRVELTKELREELEKDISNYVKWFTDNGVSSSIRIEEGDGPMETLLRVANELKADLLIVGYHHNEGVFGIFMPDTAKRIVKHATCDVILVAPMKESD